MWKCVQKQRSGLLQRSKEAKVYRKSAVDGVAGGNEMLACSACAGDYEDPDRTAWTPKESGDDDDDSATETLNEKFPAEK